MGFYLTGIKGIKSLWIFNIPEIVSFITKVISAIDKGMFVIGKAMLFTRETILDT